MKKITTILLVNLFIFSLLNNLHSQSQVIEKCGFDRLRNRLLQDSNYLRKEVEAEQKIAHYISQSQLRSSSSTYTIPVVVHVLHLGELLGVGTNISDAQIQSAITNLNNVYKGQTAGSPVDFEIEFALAQQDPNCIAHSGINRINASAVPNYLTGGVDYYGDGGEADETILKDLSRWPETEYFNIWIVSEIENNNGGFGIQGYANFFTGSAYEGSVMMATVFGYDPTNTQPSFNLNAPRDNSTVVHEIGHYLHLHHTFKGDGDADNNGIGDACPGDVTIGVDSDGCADTEPHKRYTSQCKSGLLNDCTGATFGDNTAKNFMSYASCQDRLTSDQKTRSRAMLATSGISLIYSKGDETPNISSGTLAISSCSPQTSSTGLGGLLTGIKNFTINGVFTNTSSWTSTDGGYLDNTGNCQKEINLYEDSIYNFEISTLYYGNNVKGYIDYNNDGDFFDANEQILNLNTTDNFLGNYTSSSSVNITIPTSNGTSVISGAKLRLRLNSEIASFSSVSGPCYAPEYGQVEDYTIIISSASASLNADFTVNNINVCLGTSITFSDISTGNPTSWTWDFGDGNSSTLQNPTHTYSIAGTYNVSLTVSDGAITDTETKTAFTTVGSTVNTQENITSCNNFVWNGINYFSSGSYIDTLQTSIGCDSIVTLNLIINSSGNSQENITACNNYSWNGTTYSQSGTYSSTMQTISGCDSIITLILTINQNESSQENISTCNNFTWNGNTYSQSGSYLDTLQTINGCDSIITLNLTISNYISTSENIISCNDYTWSGNIYTQSGNYTDTILVPSGCDSIKILNLVIGQTSLTNQNVTSCGTYNWNGTNYSQSGNYSDTLQSTNGCDSVLNLNLTINSSISNNESVIICDNYLWNGNNYTQSGSYNDTLSTNNGCDSIVTLLLTVNSSIVSQEIISTCGAFSWHGNTYSQSGTYYDSLSTISGCDSISSLVLTINTAQQSTDSVFSCDNYLWNGNTYLQSGIFTDTLPTSQGCDSIATLHLTIFSVFNIIDSVSSCQSYTWNGVQYDSSGIYTDTVQTAFGCDSINTLYLTVNDNTAAPLTLELMLDDYCLETFWTVKDSQDSMWYSEGPYDCNPSGGGNQANTTIIKDIYLEENECYTFELNDVYGDGLSASLWNGVDGSWTLEDLNGNVISQGQGDFGFSTSKSFYVSQSTPSFVLEEISSKLEILVYPNPFSKSTTVKIINGKSPYQLELFDIRGKIVKSFSSSEDEFLLDDINASSGTYWLKIKNQSNFKPLKLVIE